MEPDIYKLYTRRQGVGRFMETLFVQTARDCLVAEPKNEKEQKSRRDVEERLSKQTACLVTNCFDWLRERPCWKGFASLMIVGGYSSTYYITVTGKGPRKPLVEIEEINQREGSIYETEVVLTGLIEYIQEQNKPPDIEITGRKVILRQMGRNASGEPMSVSVNLEKEKAAGLRKIMRLVIDECVRRKYIKLPDDIKPKKLRCAVRKTKRGLSAEA